MKNHWLNKQEKKSWHILFKEHPTDTLVLLIFRGVDGFTGEILIGTVSAGIKFSSSKEALTAYSRHLALSEPDIKWFVAKCYEYSTGYTLDEIREAS